MNNPFLKLPVKLRLYLPLLLGIIISIAIVTWYSIYSFKKEFDKITCKNLVMETNTVMKMLERESILKQEKVKTYIKVVHELFYDKSFDITQQTFQVNALNQNTQENKILTLNQWKWNGEPLYNQTTFIDHVHSITGGTITLFQKTNDGFIRIATNVFKNDHTRAVGTFIPNESPVAMTINSGKPYVGRAFAVNDWYITVYEPIIKNNQIVGILSAGDKEKDLKAYFNILSKMHMGHSGFLFILNEKKEIIIRSDGKNDPIYSESLSDTILQKKNGFIEYNDPTDHKKKYVSFRYFENFKYYVVAAISPQDETSFVITKILISSGLTAVFIILVFSVLVYFITTENVHRFLKEIEISNKRLVTTREALKESENKFRSIFNSTSDDILLIDTEMNIIEVNDQICETLRYTREELLTMKLIDLKTPNTIEKTIENNNLVLKLGKHSYESEHLTKTGEVIHVEMNCRLVEYKNIKYILIVSRNISERKKLERKILSAVIQAEEKERERLSKDLHDGLGPLLSALKIYLNELNSTDTDAKEKEEMSKYAVELVDEAIMSTRNISNNLMPRVMSDFGLVKAIESFCKKLNVTNRVTIKLDAQHYTSCDQTLELIVYRVVNELLNNTIKHASAQQVHIALNVVNNEIVLIYEDDGIGFNFDVILNDAKTGMGLKNIISRVKSVDGTISQNSGSKGFSITIKIKTEL